ncbi:DNA methylase [Mycobacterium phage Arcanine]|nr:DNA methylase [Mycobacterium phage Arcanine]
MSNVDLRLGDCRDILTELEDDSVDSIVTDPPYELGFMSKKWDGSGIAFDVEMWEQCLRVLKPGGHLLAFGGSRTWHRLTVAIEDAGFEVRDSIAWLYGSGFPKSLNVSKAIDKAAGAEREVRQWQGWGTALKPAFEPIVVARKPLVGTVAANVLEHGTGALNIDACRIATDEDRSRPPRAANAIYGGGKGTNSTASESNPAGRWPTNVVLDETQAAELDKQSGNLPGGVTVRRNMHGQEQNANGIYGSRKRYASEDFTYGDSGGASRFFPVFKYQAKAPTRERPGYVNEDGAKVAHSTVKPLTLMRWLARLVCPPGGVILDPFAGSGTTVEACLLEGFDCIAIENEPEYIPLIEHRISRSTT